MSFKATIRTALRLVAIVAGLAACQTDVAGNDTAALPVETGSVTIMTFNVENLFDNEDDPNKHDSTYLALEDKQSGQHKKECGEISVDRWRDQCLNWDWNDELIDKKLSAVAAAILQVGNGQGPDILALQEVENLAILERLRKDYLTDANYRPAILIEGTDIRGVDVAFLSRLPLVGEAKLHKMPTEGLDKKRLGDTRGILEATFQLPDGELLTGFSVHFPAPFHPTEMRVAAYHHLNALRQALPRDHFAFAAGDFNTTSREDRDKKILQKYVRPYWTVVHDAGCTDCRGSTYYSRDDTWSYLDMILWSPAQLRDTAATWSILEGSFAIANSEPEQVKDTGTPKRFQSPGGAGVSDHWPLIVTITLN